MAVHLVRRPSVGAFTGRPGWVSRSCRRRSPHQPCTNAQMFDGLLQTEEKNADARNMSRRFTFEPDFDPRWTPRFPELAAVANSVSIAMPHVEPFVIRAVRRVAPSIHDAPLAADVARFITEEATHHVEHRRFNTHVTKRYRRLSAVDTLNRFMIKVLDRCSAKVGTGFAAGFELLGISVAMWLAPRQELLFRGAQPEAERLFLWHLGEEIGHRSIAHDVHRATGGGALTQILGLLLACFVLGLGAVVGATLVLVRDGRWYRPVGWFRLAVWAISFLWASGPMMLATLWRHPSDFPVPSDAQEWSSLSLSARLS